MTKEELEKEAEEYIDKITRDWSDGEYSFSIEELRQAVLHFAEPREKQIQIDAEQIRALQKTNGALTDRVKELEAQIEKMKCCGNCENGELSAHEEPCRHCQRCFASTDVTDQENVKDYWEAIKEIKEK